ncbi:tetratricopeptide repeat protein [Phenylobacterium immobile]|uniref:tetratricopeptide repeat protein n=1 Tax=Phenylobacterium immobile TaxID=21 RepID=UPI000AB4F4B5|nr:hypothetical protein [Phenylobacterium immobile]
MTPAPETSVVFESATLLARRLGGYSSRICAVTFSPFDEETGLERAGFGEHFFQQLGVDAVHIVPVGNHWYQYPDLPDLCAKVREAVAGYERVITYGSSMGAYAAIRFGGWVGAHAALALSPQFSIAARPAALGLHWRDYVPNDRRWRRYGQSLRFPYEARRDFARHAVIVYDPLTEDRQHAELYAATGDVTLVPAPHSGHPCGVLLTQSGLLTPLISDVLNNTFDAAHFRQEAERLGKDTPQFLIEQALRAEGRQERRRLAEMAYAAFPGNPSALRLMAQTSLAVGDHAAAAIAAQALVALEPQFQTNLFLLSQAHASAGRLEPAIAILRELVERPDHPPEFDRRLRALNRRRRLRRIFVPLARSQ